MPGTSRSAMSRVASGGEVARGEPGAAGGNDDVGRAFVAPLGEEEGDTRAVIGEHGLLEDVVSGFAAAGGDDLTADIGALASCTHIGGDEDSDTCHGDSVAGGGRVLALGGAIQSFPWSA